MARITPLPSTVTRGLVVLACAVNTSLTYRILTAGSFTDLVLIAAVPPIVVALGIGLVLGAIVLVAFVVADARAWPRASVAWGCLAIASGLAWLGNGDDSGLAILATGALTASLAIAATRAAGR